MKFDRSALEEFRSGLDLHGVYELGFVRNNAFYPKYIGKAERQTLYTRLSQYFWPSKTDRIPPSLRHHLYRHRNMVWFHVFATATSAESERRMLDRFKIGQSGLYEWNRRFEG